MKLQTTVIVKYEGYTVVVVTRRVSVSNGQLSGPKYPTRAASPIQEQFYVDVIVTVFNNRSCAVLYAVVQQWFYV